MRKLISFAVFAAIMILLLAAKSADAQVIVRARLGAPAAHLRPFPRAGYYGVRVYRPRVFAPVAYIPGRRVVRVGRFY